MFTPQLNHLTIVSPSKGFSQINHAYARALLSFRCFALKSPPLQQFILLEETYTYLGGYLSNNSLRVLPSKNCSFKNIATLCPLVIEFIACSTNSFAYLYGGFVMISPLYLISVWRKSTPPHRIHDQSNLSSILDVRVLQELY